MVGIGGSIQLELFEITIEEVYVYDGPSVKEKIHLNLFSLPNKRE